MNLEVLSQILSKLQRSRTSWWRNTAAANTAPALAGQHSTVPSFTVAKYLGKIIGRMCCIYSRKTRDDPNYFVRESEVDPGVSTPGHSVCSEKLSTRSLLKGSLWGGVEGRVVCKKGRLWHKSHGYRNNSSWGRAWSSCLLQHQNPAIPCGVAWVMSFYLSFGFNSLFQITHKKQSGHHLPLRDGVLFQRALPRVVTLQVQLWGKNSPWYESGKELNVSITSSLCSLWPTSEPLNLFFVL